MERACYSTIAPSRLRPSLGPHFSVEWPTRPRGRKNNPPFVPVCGSDDVMIGGSVLQLLKNR